MYLFDSPIDMPFNGSKGLGEFGDFFIIIE